MRGLRKGYAQDRFRPDDPSPKDGDVKGIMGRVRHPKFARITESGAAEDRRLVEDS